MLLHAVCVCLCCPCMLCAFVYDKETKPSNTGALFVYLFVCLHHHQWRHGETGRASRERETTGGQGGRRERREERAKEGREKSSPVDLVLMLAKDFISMGGLFSMTPQSTPSRNTHLVTTDMRATCTGKMQTTTHV